MAIIARLVRVYPERVLKALIDQPSLLREQLTREEPVANLCRNLLALFDQSYKAGEQRFVFSVARDAERNLYLPLVTVIAHGISTETRFGHEFFESAEYRAICALGNKIRGLIEADGFVVRGEKQQSVESFAAALDWLVGEAQRGYNIQRYKGLGEMNPEQLWETTMDPEARRMLVVTIEDAIAADQIFTTLMGDQVEPRRNFIEANALRVANLDI
jgi:DNA gyrase subunit B